jgi:UDP-N-acetylmuramyl pentapeptide phosphotransferase/UDP-N-acetylglucosamine-1-phosphate transferase
MTFYVILALSAFMISLLGTRLTILALRKRTYLIDIPNARSNHTTPTPKGGGIAVVFGMIICLLIADVSYGIMLALLMLAAISLLDDLIDVPAWIRFLVQILAVAVPLSLLNVPVFDEWLPSWLDKLIAGLLWVWFINAYNFMDGIDGISPTEMICISLGFCLISTFTNTFPDPLSTYSLIVYAAGAGFLWWNWHPAKIFLGDVGSVPIGFLLGYLLLLAHLQGYSYAAMILPAYYVSDSGITLIKRLIAGKKIWQAHSEHYYQRAVRKGMRHDTVVKFIFGLNLLLILLAVIATINPEIAIFELAMAYMSVFMVLGFFAYEGNAQSNSHLSPDQ